MLSKKDKEWIEEIIERKVYDALTVKMRMEKVRDEKTGQPLAVKETKEEDVFLPAMLVQLISFNEGALRGMQEDMNKNNNKIEDFDTKLNAIAQIVIDTEDSLKKLAMVTDRIKELEHKKDELEVIEYDESNS